MLVGSLLLLNLSPLPNALPWLQHRWRDRCKLGALLYNWLLCWWRDGIVGLARGESGALYDASEHFLQITWCFNVFFTHCLANGIQHHCIAAVVLLTPAWKYLMQLSHMTSVVNGCQGTETLQTPWLERYGSCHRNKLFSYHPKQTKQWYAWRIGYQVLLLAVMDPHELSIVKFLRWQWTCLLWVMILDACNKL